MPEPESAPLREAARRGDHAGVLRLARIGRGWTQADLGARFGCSPSAISRYETGQRKLDDVATLRRLAGILGLPPAAFGLAAVTPARPASAAVAGGAPRVSGESRAREVDDPVHRRAFLVAAGLAGIGTSAAGGDGRHADPAALLTQRLRDVLLAPAEPAPAPSSAVRSWLHAAAVDFHACDYTALAGRLPQVIAAAHASDAAGDADAPELLAQAYSLATRAALKLAASGLEWIAADRALAAARRAGNPLSLAEAHRLMGSVCRRAGDHDRAVRLTLQAADQLDLRNPRPSPTHLARYGVLMCSAGYAHARAGDRDAALDLLTEASGAVARLGHDPRAQRELAANVLSHRVSAEYVLGNAGLAVHHARQADLATFPDTERRARFLVDVALSYAQLDKPDQSYRTVLAAERAAPGEIRTRATVRRLVADLLANRRQAAMPGLRDLAARTHVLGRYR